MTITIELRPDAEQVLRERARESGRELPEYVQHVLEEHIRSAPRPEAASGTFDQVLAPVWEGGATERHGGGRDRRHVPAGARGIPSGSTRAEGDGVTPGPRTGRIPAYDGSPPAAGISSRRRALSISIRFRA